MPDHKTTPSLAAMRAVSPNSSTNAKAIKAAKNELAFAASVLDSVSDRVTLREEALANVMEDKKLRDNQISALQAKLLQSQKHLEQERQQRAEEQKRHELTSCHFHRCKKLLELAQEEGQLGQQEQEMQQLRKLLEAERIRAREIEEAYTELDEAYTKQAQHLQAQSDINSHIKQQQAGWEEKSKTLEGKLFGCRNQELEWKRECQRLKQAQTQEMEKLSVLQQLLQESIRQGEVNTRKMHGQLHEEANRGLQQLNQRNMQSDALRRQLLCARTTLENEKAKHKDTVTVAKAAQAEVLRLAAELEAASTRNMKLVDKIDGMVRQMDSLRDDNHRMKAHLAELDGYMLQFQSQSSGSASASMILSASARSPNEAWRYI